jgi:hypothetical protein
MLLPGRQDGEVVDESLHFAFPALRRKENSRRWSGGRTRYGGSLWDRRRRSPFLNFKRINESNRFHHNVPPVFVVCSVYHELIPLSPDHSEKRQVRLSPRA